MNRTRKSIWGIASGLTFTLVSLCTGIIATPWLLHWLGRERFGIYHVLSDWMGYIGLFELGLGGALMARLAVAVGRNDETGMRRLIASGLRAYSWVALAMLTAGVTWVAALPQLLAAETFSASELRIAALILLTLVLWTPLSVFRLLAEARQRGYIVSLLLTVQSVLITGLLVVTAWAGWGLTGQSIATIVPQFLIAFVLMWYGVRTYKGVLAEKSDSETMRKVWSLNWPTFVFNVSSRVGLLTDNIIIAWAVGPLAVASFFLTQRLATIALSQLQGIGNATWAGLVELYAQGQVETFHSRLLELTGMVSSLSLCLLGPIAAYNHYFIERWVGPSNFAGEAVNVIACFNIWFWAIISLWGWPVSGTGNIRSWVPYAVSSTLVNLLCSIVGTLTLGLIGPLVGTLIAFVLIQSWAMPRVLHRLFALSPWSLWRVALAPLAWGLPYILILWLVAHSHTPWGWLGLMMEMGLAGTAGLGLWWIISLSSSNRAVWVARFQGALGR